MFDHSIIGEMGFIIIAVILIPIDAKPEMV